MSAEYLEGETEPHGSFAREAPKGGAGPLRGAIAEICANLENGKACLPQAQVIRFRRANSRSTVSRLRRIAARLRVRSPIVPLLCGVLLAQTLYYFVANYTSGLIALGILSVGFVLIEGIETRRSRHCRTNSEGETSELLPGCCSSLVRLFRPVRNLIWGAVLGGWAIALQDPLSLSTEASMARVTGHFIIEVVNPPQRPKPGGVRFDGRVRFQARERRGTEGKVIAPRWLGRLVRCKAVDLPWREIADLRQGDVLAVQATMKEVERSGGPISYQAGLRRRGVRGECRIDYSTKLLTHRANFFARTRRQLGHLVKSVLGSGEKSGLVLALVLGERDGLSEATERAFRRTGLSHVLVLSGYQVSLVFGSLWAICCGVLLAVTRALQGVSRIAALFVRAVHEDDPCDRVCETLGRAFFVGEMIRIAPQFVALACTLTFVLVVGIESSSMRAALGLCVLVAAHVLERDTSMWNLLAVSLFMMSMLWPGIFLEPSAQLTFAALCGIALGKDLALPGEARMRGYLRISFWATLLPLGVALVWFHTFPVVGLVLNPIAAPIIATFGTLGGAIAMLLCVVSMKFGGIALALVANGLEMVREAVVALSQATPLWLVEPPPVGRGIYLVFIFGLAAHAAMVLLGRRRRSWSL